MSEEPGAGELRQDLRRVHEDLSRLTSQLLALQRRTQQVSALQAEAADARARIARLEGVLEFDHVAAHVRQAVAQTRLAQDPVPHAIVADVLPRDVYQTVIDAIPSPLFFDGETAVQELRMPPRLAPAHAIVTWTFLTDVVLDALAPALVTCFEAPLAAFARARFPELPPFSEWDVEVTLSQGRLVRRSADDAAATVPDRPWDFLSGVLHLARSHDSGEYGGRLRGTHVPCAGNEALVFLGPADTYQHTSIPAAAAPGTERYTYEFGIGPTRHGRRRLTAMLKRAGAIDPVLSTYTE